MLPTTVAEAARILRVLGANIMGVGLLALGAACLFDPAAASVMYGLPATERHGLRWVVVAGIRDAGLGVATLALQHFSPASIRILAPAVMGIPLADAAATFLLGGTAAEAAVHVVGTICIGILSLCAWLDPTLDAHTKRA